MQRALRFSQRNAERTCCAAAYLTDGASSASDVHRPVNPKGGIKIERVVPKAEREFPVRRRHGPRTLPHPSEEFLRQDDGMPLNIVRQTFRPDPRAVGQVFGTNAVTVRASRDATT